MRKRPLLNTNILVISGKNGFRHHFCPLESRFLMRTHVPSQHLQIQKFVNLGRLAFRREMSAVHLRGSWHRDFPSASPRFHCSAKKNRRQGHFIKQSKQSKQSNHLHFRQVKPSIVSNVSKLFKLSWALLLLIHCSGCPPCKILHTGRVVCRANDRGGGHMVYNLYTSLPSHLKSEIEVFWWLPSYLTQSLQSHFSTKKHTNIGSSIVNWSKLLRPFQPALDTVRNVVSG